MGAGGGHPSRPARGMGERCKLPHRGLGLRPRSVAICAIFVFNLKAIRNLITFLKNRLESFMKRMQLCDQSQSATGTFYKFIHYFNQTELVCKDGCKYGKQKCS